MPRQIRLNDVIRPNQRPAAKNLGQVRWALSHLGLFDPAIEPRSANSLMSLGLRRALRTFQSGQGLREDATLAPRGPTEARLNLLLDQGQGLRARAPDAGGDGSRNPVRTRDAPSGGAAGSAPAWRTIPTTWQAPTPHCAGSATSSPARRTRLAPAP